MSRRVQALFWIGALLVFLGFLWILSGVLLPFVAGMAVAYFLDPSTDRLERMGLSRTLATCVVLTLFFGFLVLALILIYPLVTEQLLSLVGQIPKLFEQMRQTLLPLLRRALSDLPTADADSVKQIVGSSAEKAVAWAGGLVGGILGGGLALVNFLSLMVITPIVAFYLLRDWDRMVTRLDAWLPRQHAEIIRIQAKEIDRTLAGFVRGQGTVCLFMALYYGLSLTIIGLDYGLIIGLVSGAVTFIPYVGATFGFVVSTVVALVQFWPDWPWIITTIVVFLFGQFVEGNFVTPYLVGNRVGLHPVWIMFALLAFGAVFGFVGVLIAVPVAAVIGVLSRFIIGRYLNSRIYLGPVDPNTTPPAASGNP